MDEKPNMRQVSLRLDSQETSTVDSGMSELQIKELARRERARKTVRNWVARYPERKQAHKDVERALREGVLVRPHICNRCQKDTYVVAHHADYSKPLDVEWLCDLCHMRHHKLGKPRQSPRDILPK